jgi:sugar phosphate isomerase/epimerase
VDTLHVDRSATPVADLVMVPRQWLHYAQICDAPAEQPATVEAMIHCARAERLFPGEGGLDLAAMLRALPPDLPISVEVPKQQLARTVGAEARARLALEATQSVLQAVG